MMAREDSPVEEEKEDMEEGGRGELREEITRRMVGQEVTEARGELGGSVACGTVTVWVRSPIGIGARLGLSRLDFVTRLDLAGIDELVVFDAPRISEAQDEAGAGAGRAGAWGVGGRVDCHSASER